LVSIPKALDLVLSVLGTFGGGIYNQNYCTHGGLVGRGVCGGGGGTFSALWFFLRDQSLTPRSVPLSDPSLLSSATAITCFRILRTKVSSLLYLPRVLRFILPPFFSLFFFGRSDRGAFLAWHVRVLCAFSIRRRALSRSSIYSPSSPAPENGFTYR